MEIKTTIEKVHQNAIDKGFWNGELDIPKRLMLIVSEVSEAMEADRKGSFCNLPEFEARYREIIDSVNGVQQDPKSVKTESEIIDEVFKKVFAHRVKNTFPDELADVVIRVFDLCGKLNIDLEKHIEYKMKYNSMREHMHGKKY